MSIHRLSAGNGFRYLLRNTASSDVQRHAQLPLTEYYTQSGNPAGRWLGSGLAGLADGRGVRSGAPVTDHAMTAVFGRATDPVTGTALGRGFTSRVDADGVRRPHGVAGFDLTFTAPKSASVLWALGDRRTRQAVDEAHHAAVAHVIELIEARVLATRVGHGGAAQVSTRGLIAAAFDHPDTRTGDPNLHTHLVVANRVQGRDGRWRAIDAQPLFAAAVALSETYDALLSDELARRLPVRFGFRSRGERRTPAFEVEGVDERLLALFSTRAIAIGSHLETLTAQFVTEHGRNPSRTEVTRLRQTATLATRPVKRAHAWSELFTVWAQRAAAMTRRPTKDLFAAALDGTYTRPLKARDIGPDTRRRLAVLALVGVQERRSTWNAWNLEAEIARLTKPLSMASAADRASLHATVLQQALAQSVPLHDEPAVDRWTKMRLRWTSTSILDAEAHLLEIAETGRGPRIDPRVADIANRLLAQPGAIPRLHGRALAADQLAAVGQVCASGRGLEVLVGPAGSGKTITLRAIREVWDVSPWTGSVVGLAPSATAAKELSAALGLRCETTAKWLHETTGPGGQARLADLAVIDAALAADPHRPSHQLLQQRRTLTDDQARWQLIPGQFLIVDEASLAGTLELDHLVTQAQAAGAKTLLVGDHQQLSAVQAGGALGLLARRTQTAELTSLWRFTHRWEAQATRQLRAGDEAALDAYAAHDRLRAGPRDAMLDAAYDAWRADTDQGHQAVLIAADQETVTELNRRARADAVLAGRASRAGVALIDGTTAGVGDTVITRRNNRGLRVGADDHVRNGSTWTVAAAHPDGTLSVVPLEPAGDGPRPRPVELPAAYVAEHVDLGYAITAQRVQSRTVNTAHVITGPGMGREHLYVAMTRGRHANHAYTPTDATLGAETEPHHDHGTAGEVADARKLLAAILRNSAAEPSATESLPTYRHPQPGRGSVLRPQTAPRRIDTPRPRVPDGHGLSR